MNAKAILAPLSSWRVWLAAGMALLGSWIAVSLALFAVPLAVNELALVFDLSGLPRPVLQSVLTAIALAAAVEGSKAASLVWPLRRRWDNWMSLGAAFGILQAVGVVAGWAIDRERFGSLVAPFSPMLPILAARLLIIHWALGRLAAGAARPPGGPWLALLLATVASGLINLLPLEPLVFLVRLPYEVYDAAPWFEVALSVMFALAVWRWVPGPAAHPASGPARWIAVTLLAFVGILCLTVAASVAILGSGSSDPISVLVVALGVTFVAWTFYRQVLQAWARRSD